MVDIATAWWVDTSHSGAAVVILQARAVVCDVDVDGACGASQSKPLHSTSNPVRS